MKKQKKTTNTNDPNRIKVCHIITGLTTGGAETVLKRLIESDPESIPDIVVVSLTHPLAIIGESLLNQGVKVYALNLSPLGFNIPIILWQLVKLIRQYQPQIVQTWMYHADLLGGVAAYLAGQRNIVWNIRIAAVPKDNKLTIAIVRISALLSHWLPQKIVCVAEAAKRLHIDYGYDANRMVVIHNGLDIANFTANTAQIAALRQQCFAENEMVIGWVGRFHPDKGHENFVKAAAIIVKSYPQAKFLLVGEDCDVNNTQLMASLTGRDLLRHFILLGERSDVPVCLAVMDIFCMPSSNEGFPNALVEAMAMGLPCIATDVGDTAFLVGDTAIVVPPQNEQALAEGLLQVIALSAKQREQMGQQAKERVRSEFSIEKARARFEAVYKEVMSKNKI